MTAFPERLTFALADRYAVECELGQGGMATAFSSAERASWRWWKISTATRSGWLTQPVVGDDGAPRPLDPGGHLEALLRITGEEPGAVGPALAQRPIESDVEGVEVVLSGPVTYGSPAGLREGGVTPAAGIIEPAKVIRGELDHYGLRPEEMPRGSGTAAPRKVESRLPISERNT